MCFPKPILHLHLSYPLLLWFHALKDKDNGNTCSLPTQLDWMKHSRQLQKVAELGDKLSTLLSLTVLFTRDTPSHRYSLVSLLDVNPRLSQ
ncbi:hypothetical protein E2C01_044106 [Portunus trituberculatus]|uniref:Uncharacterized protein n=1 Tax=Portunus trituberculatus TaxID=210409 RepID=A0A5B7FUP7_PORTR|nr:hypothetical protein [Portunus trituberculatus]